MEQMHDSHEEVAPFTLPEQEHVQSTEEIDLIYNARYDLLDTWMAVWSLN